MGNLASDVNLCKRFRRHAYKYVSQINSNQMTRPHLIIDRDVLAIESRHLIGTLQVETGKRKCLSDALILTFQVNTFELRSSLNFFRASMSQLGFPILFT